MTPEKGAGVVNMPAEGAASEAPLITGWDREPGLSGRQHAPRPGGGEESTELSTEKFPTKESE